MLAEEVLAAEARGVYIPDSHVWTYGESNPDLVHAMDAFYR